MAKNKGGREVRKPKQASTPKPSANASTTVDKAANGNKKSRGA